ncbi:bifunctional 3-phenylpropionate/cinnamic acid dioxygenase ferredoxin subunit [Pseudonocardia hispaniensis]|uniref:Bifunctional 3-phenylpropionate/cinnamic acid dioxygenase ferredoxin subunit n=1 Tax=Pseudonocardia hispaniensis TaxID=904933 RepID=A0ABW1J137_9PSEU
MAWVRACGVSEIKPGEAVRIDAEPPVAVFNIDGEFFATADTCTHEEASLADGYVDGAQVECAWHFAKFCLRTGRALSLPATEDLATYRVRVADDAVFIDI